MQHLTFETSYAGLQLLQNNPYVDKLNAIDPTKLSYTQLKKLWELGEKTHDLYFNLFNMLEYKYIAMEDQSDFYRDSSWRRKMGGEINYYDAMTMACELPDKYLGTTGELYYDKLDEISAVEWVESVKKKYSINYIILINLSGSSLHKKFVQAESICRKLLSRDDKLYIILTGDKNCENQVFSGERIMSKVGGWNFRTAALMAKYMDLVISLESGLAVISNMWNTPTLQLMTAANRNNHSKYAKNAHTIQSPISCSPCHKGPYAYVGCPVIRDHPACVWFDEDRVIKIIEEIKGVCPKEFA